MRHGGNIREAERHYGHKPGTMLDLSTGICPNPWPIPPALLNPTDWHCLPQSSDTVAVIDAVRKTHALPPDADIALAPGSQIIINLLPYLAQSNTVHIPQPCYGDYAAAWATAGKKIIPYPAGHPPKSQKGSVIAVQPGNPMGETTALGHLLAAAATAHTHNGFLVVDEAFVEINPDLTLLPHTGNPGVIVLRSLGKFYGLAGVRLGLAVGQHPTIARLKNLLGEWAVSTLAVRIGAGALADTDFQASQRQWIATHHQRMLTLFTRHGLRVIGGTGLFSLIAHPKAQELHQSLAHQGIWTRVFADEPQWLRIGLADSEGQARLDNALQNWQDKCPD